MKNDMIMTAMEFVGRCLGVYPSTESLFDELEENFNVEVTEDMVLEYLQCCDTRNLQLGNWLILRCFEKVFSNLEKDVNDEDAWEKVNNLCDYYVNDLDSHIYFNNEEFYDYDSLLDTVNDYINNEE